MFQVIHQAVTEEPDDDPSLRSKLRELEL